MIGQRFGRLTILESARMPRGSTRSRPGFRVACDCGAEKIVLAQSIERGSTVSCGCFGREHCRQYLNPRSNLKHGRTGTREHGIWLGMRRRCNSSAERSFPFYGGRGIRICDRWQKFEHFLADMGSSPEGMSIERRDLNRGYEPSNCMWATPVQQANNKSNNRIVDNVDAPMTLAQYAKHAGISYELAQYRARVGYIKTHIRGYAPPASAPC